MEALETIINLLSSKSSTIKTCLQWLNLELLEVRTSWKSGGCSKSRSVKTARLFHVFVFFSDHSTLQIMRKSMILYSYCVSILGFPESKKQESQKGEKMMYTSETNITPENGWLEYWFPSGMAYF